MGWKRSRLRRVTISLGLLACVALAVPAFASAARVLYASGHPIDTARLSKFGGNTLTGTFDGCSDSEWAAALARTDFDVLIVGEHAPQCSTPLDVGTLTAIRNYVSSGHPYIQTGAHGDEYSFMNDVFGFSTTNETEDGDLNLISTLQPGATGTAFAGGPASLLSLSETEILGGTPGTTLYSGNQGIWAFTAPVGAGTVTYLGWDLCGEPDQCENEAPGAEDAWYQVLNRATFNNNFTVDSITRNKKKGTATITIGVSVPGEMTGSGNGVKAASAGRAVTSKSVGAGQVKLVIKAKGKKKRKLAQKGKVKVNVAIAYTPTGGKTNTKSVKVKLKKKVKK